MQFLLKVNPKSNGMYRFFRFTFPLALFLTISVWLCSCGNSVPRKYLQPDELEDVLYDYHVALGMVSSNYEEMDKRAYNERLYKLAVLKKHGVSEEKFEKSMVYYMRHAEDLQKIYKSLSERVRVEATQMGASIGTMDSGLTAVGDTANIWPIESGLVLMQRQPYHVVSFEIKADTTFHKGDRFNLGFDSQFLFQEGFKDGIAMLTLRFQNDSVATRSLHFSSNSRYNLDLNDNDRLGVKEIRGFFYLNKEQNVQTSTTLKLLFLSRIQLLRMRSQEPKPLSTTLGESAQKSSEDGRANTTDSPQKIQSEPSVPNMPKRELVR